MLVVHLAGRTIPKADVLHPFHEANLILRLFVPLARFIITKVRKTGAHRLQIGWKLESCLPGIFQSRIYLGSLNKMSTL